MEEAIKKRFEELEKSHAILTDIVLGKQLDGKFKCPHCGQEIL